MNMKFNNLITRMFSDPEFEQKVNEKVDEAKENGSATLEEDGEKLQFADAGNGEVIVEDKNNDEATVISDTEDGEREIHELPSEDTKTESDTQPDVKTEVVEGKDGDHVTDTVPEIKVEVSTGVNDSEKAGLKAYSLVFSNVDATKAAKYTKAFSDAIESILVTDEVGDIAEHQKDTEEAMKEQGERAGKLADTPCPEKTFTDEDVDEATEIINDAKQLQNDVDEVKESKDAEKIESCKKMSKSILSRANKLFSKGHDVSSLMSQVLTFSEELDALQETKPEEVKSETEEVTAAEKVESPKAKETPVEEDRKADMDEATKAECDQKQFSACLHTSFGDCSVRPIVTPSVDRTFSTTTESKETTKKTNPFLYTKFE